MSYNLFFDYDADDFIDRIISDYNNRVKEGKLNSFFYESLPIFVSQSEGIKKYLLFKLTQKNKVLLNINSFNLQSFYNEYSKPYLQEYENIDKLDKPKPENKDTIFWFLYGYFFDKISNSFYQIKENQDSKFKVNDNFKQEFNDGKEKSINIKENFIDDKNEKFSFYNDKSHFIYSEDFKKFVNFLIIFSDLYEQYETFRDFDIWDLLKNQDLTKVDCALLNSFYEFNENGKFIIKSKIYDDSFQIELIKLIINSPLKNTKYHILKRMKNDDIKPKFPKNPLFFIAFDSIPYFYFIFLKKISEFVDINFYFLLPSKTFLSEIKSDIDKIKSINEIKYYTAKIKSNNEIKYNSAKIKSNNEIKYDINKIEPKNRKESNFFFDEEDFENEDEKSKSYLVNFCIKRQKEFMKEFLKFFPVTFDFQKTNYIKNIENICNEKSSRINQDGKEANLLNKYQLFLKTSESMPDSFIKSDALDDSIQILSNYTELRELEVIKDKILEILSKDKSLKYEEIIIMAVNIDSYLPYIKLVFNFQEPSLPIFVVDRDSSKDSEIFKIINFFFELLSNNFKKNDFINFLSNEIIMEKFDLKEKDIEIFNRQFSNYLWGSDFDDILEYYEEISDKNLFEKNLMDKNSNNRDFFENKNLSSQFNIESLFLSNAIGYISTNSYFEKDAFIEVNNVIIPLNTEIEGDFIETIEKIFLAYRLLLYFYKFIKKPHHLADYKIFFEEFFDYLILDSEEYHDEILYYRNKINEFFDEIKINSKEIRLLSFDILKLTLQNYLKSYQYSYGYTTGKILFSEMVSLRNVPAKVVAILGLNDINFPRNITPFSFDLMLKDKKCWDRDIRESDKYLFLESILSAKEYLFLSYIGRNAKDNKVRAPSIALKILQEDINSNLLKDCLLESIQMPIQPFSKKYFFKNFDISNNTYFLTYNRSWKTFFENLLIKRIEEKEEKLIKNVDNNFNDNLDKKINKNLSSNILDYLYNNILDYIDLEDFLSFLKDPLKVYLTKVLSVDLYLNDYDFDNEFDQYVGKKDFEKLFFSLLNLNLKSDKQTKSDEEKENEKSLIDYYKLKYLKPRGVLTEIDFNLIKENVFDFSLRLKGLIRPEPNDISIKQVTIKEESIEDLIYPVKFSYYQIFIDDNKKTEFILLYQNDKDDFLYHFYFILLTKIYNIDKITNFDLNEKNRIAIAKLVDSKYDINNSFDSQDKKESSIKVEDKTEYLQKIYYNATIMKDINKNISALFSFYDEMIINMNFLPISLFTIEDYKKDIAEYKKIFENNFDIKEKFENHILGKFSDKDFFNLIKFYKISVLLKYIDRFSDEDSQEIMKKYISSLSIIIDNFVVLNNKSKK